MSYYSFSYHCRECKEDVQLEMEIDSPSDYYLLDRECPSCGVDIDEDKLRLDQKAADHYAGRADDYRDRLKDNYD